MDRAVRFSLFALGTFIGALLVTVAVESPSEPTQARVLVKAGQADQAIDGFTRMNVRMGIELALRRALPPNPAKDESALDEVDDLAAIEARDREVGARRAALINAKADQEAVDPDWAPSMQAQMVERFAVHGPKGAKLVSATCKTSLCIAEVESLSRRDSSGQMGWSAMFGLGRGFVMNHETAVEDEYRSVVYLARDGYSLPK